MRKKMQPSDHHSAVEAYVTIVKMRLDSYPKDGGDWRTIALQLRRAASSASAIAKAYDEADAVKASTTNHGHGVESAPEACDLCAFEREESLT